MNNRFFRRGLAVFLAMCMVLGPALPVRAAERARVINLFRIDGDNVTLTRGARTTTPREGQRLSAGNVLATGRDSFVHLLLDADSILLMDQQSRVAVSSARRRLSLSVQSGEALLNVGAQDEGQTLETRIGNTGLTVRGTLFTIGRGADGSVTITMLSGMGEVNGIPLGAGLTMTVTQDDAEEPTIEISGLVPEDMSLLTLQAIMDNSEQLLEMGIIDEALLGALPPLIEQRQAEQAELRAQQDAAAEAAMDDVEEPRVPMPTPVPRVDDMPTPHPDDARPPEPGPGPGPGPGPDPDPSPPPPLPPMPTDLPEYITITFSPGAGGSIEVYAYPDSPGNPDFPVTGTRIPSGGRLNPAMVTRITAVPDPGFFPYRWYIDGHHAPQLDYSMAIPERQWIFDVNYAVTFVPIPAGHFAVTMFEDGRGDRFSSLVGFFAPGATVNVTAGTPPAGATGFHRWESHRNFDWWGWHWGGADWDVVDFANPAATSTSFVMPAHHVTLRPTWVWPPGPPPPPPGAAGNEVDAWMLLSMEGSNAWNRGSHGWWAPPPPDVVVPEWWAPMGPARAGVRAGHVFTGWTSDPPIEFANPQNPVTLFRVPLSLLTQPGREIVVTANWSPAFRESFTTWIDAQGGQGATVNGSPFSGAAFRGDTVTIDAGTRPGYVFAGWTRHFYEWPINLADPLSPVTTFTMPARGVSVIATWRPAANISPPGSGTLASPYILSTSADWEWLRDYGDTTGRYFMLGGEFTVGFTIPEFGGTLNGNSHIINLIINPPTPTHVGLFGEIAAGARVQHLNLTGDVFTGPNHLTAVGALAGVNAGHIENVFSDVHINGTGSAAGGLVGVNTATGTIVGSSAHGTVSNGADFARTGGLVGEHQGNISRSFATGLIFAAGDVGGLVGFSFNGTIQDAYATGMVVGTDRGVSNVGGLVGQNNGTINRAFATGDVSAFNIDQLTGGVGGITGRNSGLGTISNSVSFNVNMWLPLGMNPARRIAYLNFAGAAALVNNYAHVGVLINGEPFPGPHPSPPPETPDSLDGNRAHPDALAVYESFWMVGMNWSDSVWSFAPDRPPILLAGDMGIGLAGQENPEFPPLPAGFVGIIGFGSNITGEDAANADEIDTGLRAPDYGDATPGDATDATDEPPAAKPDDATPGETTDATPGGPGETTDAKPDVTPGGPGETDDATPGETTDATDEPPAAKPDEDYAKEPNNPEEPNGESD